MNTVFLEYKKIHIKTHNSVKLLVRIIQNYMLFVCKFKNYLMRLSIADTLIVSKCMMIVNNELENVWKETVVAVT
jgi:hypothetical protein